LNQKVFQSLNDIIPVTTVHNIGEKFVFLKQQDTETLLTQFAYGKLMPGEDVEEHLHPTMEEYFYFINGEGEYTIGNDVFSIKPATFFRIPANTKHALKPTGAQPLLFVYFGIAVQ
jgi:mannose-6-phosphate isomerase-like protein (cupin superfamily)